MYQFWCSASVCVCLHTWPQLCAHNHACVCAQSRRLSLQDYPIQSHPCHTCLKCCRIFVGTKRSTTKAPSRSSLQISHTSFCFLPRSPPVTVRLFFSKNWIWFFSPQNTWIFLFSSSKPRHVVCVGRLMVGMDSDPSAWIVDLDSELQVGAQRSGTVSWVLPVCLGFDSVSERKNIRKKFGGGGGARPRKSNYSEVASESPGDASQGAFLDGQDLYTSQSC